MGRRVEVGEDVSGYDLHPTSAGALLAVSAEESFKECVVHEGGALAMLQSARSEAAAQSTNAS